MNVLNHKINNNDLYFYSFLVIYFGSLVFLGLREYIWLDEAYSLLTSSSTVKFAFNKALLFELQPPLFYVLLSIWRDIDSSIPFARILSIVFLFISVFPLKALLKTLYGKRHIIYSVLFLLNTFIFMAAFEIRYLTFLLLFTILIEYIFLKSYMSEKPKLHFRVIYVVFSIMGVYTQYYFSFLLMANFVVLFAHKRKFNTLRYLIDMVWPVLALCLLIPYIGEQVSYSTNSCSVEVSLKYYLLFLGNTVANLLVSMPKLPFEYLKFFIHLLFSLFIAVPLFINIRKASWRILLQNQFFIKLIIIVVCFGSLITVLKTEAMPIRHLTIVFVPLWLFSFDFLDRIRNKKMFISIITIMLIVFIGYNSYKQLKHPKGHQFKEISKLLMAKEKPGENIFIYSNQLALVLEPAYKGINKLYPLPKAIDPNEVFNLGAWSINNSTELDSILKPYAKNNFWMVTGDNSKMLKHYCINYNDNMLENYLSSNFIPEEENEIGGVLIRKFKNK